LGPASLTKAEAERLRDDYLATANQASVGIGGAVLFRDFARIYERDVLSTWASTTQNRSKSVLKVHLNPAFGDLMLRELTLEVLQHYFACLQTTKMSAEGVDKVKDVLSAVLGTAVTYGRLSTNPAEKIRLRKRKLTKPKPFIRVDLFNCLVESIMEPYATMVYVAVSSSASRDRSSSATLRTAALFTENPSSRVSVNFAFSRCARRSIRFAAKGLSEAGDRHARDAFRVEIDQAAQTTDRIQFTGLAEVIRDRVNCGVNFNRKSLDRTEYNPVNLHAEVVNVEELRLPKRGVAALQNCADNEGLGLRVDQAEQFSRGFSFHALSPNAGSAMPAGICSSSTELPARAGTGPGPASEGASSRNRSSATHRSSRGAKRAPSRFHIGNQAAWERRMRSASASGSTAPASLAASAC
jgi:hypothetical protein